MAAATPEAAAAGVAMLERGGNAIDAAVAAALCLAVTEPAGSGLGGQTTFLVQRPGEPAFVINGTSFAPAAATGVETLDDLVGARASTVPSTPRVLASALARFGSGAVGWGDVLGPAIAAADEGYALGAFRRAALHKHAEVILRDEEARSLLLPGGSIPAAGSLVRAPALARTLERLAREGVEDFYTGAIGAAIASDMAARGGLVTQADLAAVVEPPVVPALVGSFRGHRVSTLPPPASGWVGLLALGVLEVLGEPSAIVAERVADAASALAAAHRERARRGVYERDEASERCSAEAARAIADAVRGAPAPRAADRLAQSGGGETTHFSVVDADGMVVAVTQSLNAYFGAKVGCPRTGVLYNDYMRDFVLGGERPRVDPKAGRAPYSAMCAMIFARGDEPRMTLGSPGDERILSAVFEVARRWIDEGEAIAEAVAAPRFHPLVGGELLTEEALAVPEILRALEARGFAVMVAASALFAGARHPYFGGVHAIARDATGWSGAADPRRDGAVRSART